MLAGLEHRIGGTSTVMLPPEVFPSCFLCLVNVTGVNHFYSLWWNKLNLGLLHWQYLASNMAPSNWLVKCWGKACKKVFRGGRVLSGWTQLVVRCRIKTTFGLHKMSGCKDDTYRNHVLQCQTLCSSRNRKFSWLVQFSFKLLLIRQCHSNLLLLLFSSSVKKRLIFSFMFIWYTMNWATVDQDTLTI